MARLPNLEIGTVFNKMGKWYSVIDEVIKNDGRTALVKAHEDDGFVQYVIFENNDGWKTSYSSTQLDAMEWQYKITVDYKATH